MNSYEAKQEARRQRLLEAAERADAKARAAYKRADLREEVSGIPLGQPILVGHHSERRHRRAIERADNAMRASIEASNRAAELRARADGVGSGGISSDDPDAIDKLQEKLDQAKARQAFMRAANKVIRRAVRNGIVDADSDGFVAYLAELDGIAGGKMSAAGGAELLKPDFCGRIGFAGYQLSNNNANIKRMEQRIAQLATASQAEEKRMSFQGLCELVENVDENRLQLIFDGKPSAEIRSELKSYGFRWAPSQGAWQRQLNNGARYAARRFLRSQGIEI